ncbi:MAG: helix-turn-helix transcriptional regulator [Hydrogenophaga sp.]
MRAKQAAQHFGIAHSTLWLWVKSKEGFPQPIKASARVTLFDIDAIEQFLRESYSAIA